MKQFFIKLSISLVVLYGCILIGFDTFKIDEKYHAAIYVLALILLRSVYQAVSMIMKKDEV